MTSAWTNYGSAEAGSAALGQAGAAAIAHLARFTDAGSIVVLGTHLREWARSPDIYALVMDAFNNGSPSDASARPPVAMAEIEGLLQLYWRLDCFPKPLVSLLDTALSPLAIGLTTFGTHRVAAPSYRFSIPATTDAAVPPAAGVVYALSRLLYARGVELALTGREIGPAEAWAAGLVTHCIAADAFPGIIAALADGQPVDPLLDDLHRDPDPPSDAPADQAIMRCFEHDRVADIEVALARETGDSRPWAERALAALRARPALHTAAMLHLIRMTGTMDVRESLITTHRAAAALRAADLASPPSANEPFPIDALFSRAETAELSLPLRAEIANDRF